MADIQVNGTSIGQRDFEIEIGISDKVVAPTAQFEARTRESVTAGDDVDILLNGTVRFSGIAVSGGTIDRSGQRTVSCEHPAAALFEDAVTLDETGPPTDEDVLQAALVAAEDGGNFTLDYAGTATTLQSAYTATTRSVKSIFRDMTDRTGRIWWVEPAGTTIHVEPRGDRGTFIQFNEDSGEGRIDRFEEGGVDTVKNDIVVKARTSPAPPLTPRASPPTAGVPRSLMSGMRTRRRRLTPTPSRCSRRTRCRGQPSGSIGAPGRLHSRLRTFRLTSRAARRGLTRTG
jgi:hypothetical protein